MIHWPASRFILACLTTGLVVNAWSHVPVPLGNVPEVVLESVLVMEPGMIIHEVAVDVSHSEVPIDGYVTTYVINGTSSRGKDLAVEITSSGLILQVYDGEYFEQFIED